MLSKKVVQLGSVRELLMLVDELRGRILAGKTTDIHATLMNDGGEENVIASGVYVNDPQLAIRAILNASARRMLAQDDPPKLRGN